MAFNPNKCLKFIAEDNFTLQISASPVDGSHYKFSKDGINWVDDEIALVAGESAYCKGTNYPSLANVSTCMFYTTPFDSKVALEGNIMSLIDDGAGELLEIEEGKGFASLFSALIRLTSIPAGLLPATKISEYCYAYMFNTSRYYDDTFDLPDGFVLPAMDLPKYCYQDMFKGQHGITRVPTGMLPATFVNAYSYDGMFWECRNLKVVEEKALMATSFYLRGEYEDDSQAVRYMFYNTQLNSIYLYFTGWLTSGFLQAGQGFFPWHYEGIIYCPSTLEEASGRQLNINNMWTALPLDATYIHYPEPVPPGPTPPPAESDKWSMHIQGHRIALR